MLVCPLSIFAALALVSVVGEKGKTGVKQLKKGKKKSAREANPHCGAWLKTILASKT